MPDGFVEHPVHLPQTPVHRAASLIRAAMLYRQQLKLGQAEPEKTKEGPICMDTYRCVEIQYAYIAYHNDEYNTKMDVRLLSCPRAARGLECQLRSRG